MTEDIDYIDEVLSRWEDWMHGQDGKDVTDCRKRLATIRKRLKKYQEHLLVDMIREDEKLGLYGNNPKD